MVVWNHHQPICSFHDSVSKTTNDVPFVTLFGHNLDHSRLYNKIVKAIEPIKLHAAVEKIYIQPGMLYVHRTVDTVYVV